MNSKEGEGRAKAVIVVTPGERELISEFERAGVHVVVKNLLVGDVCITTSRVSSDDACKFPAYIFERKARGDLYASICDRRYKEQKMRLMQVGLDRHRIVFVIEQLHKSPRTTVDTAVWSAICNTLHRDGFSIFQTMSAAETVKFISGIASSIDKYDLCTDVKPEDLVNAAIKKKSVGAEEWYKMSLTLLPRCSVNMAEAIVREYPTIRSLYDSICKKGGGVLEDIVPEGGKKKIGKKLSNTVCTAVTKAFSQ